MQTLLSSTARSLALLAGILVLMETPPCRAADADKPDPAKLAATVKDILRSRCLECHGGNSTQDGVDVLDRESLLSRETVVPGQPDASRLYRAVITADEDARMPEGQPPLSASEIETIRQWILAQAPEFPADVKQPAAPAKGESFQGVEGVEYVLQQILAHQRTLTSDERRFTRYFSCHHLLAAGATRDLLDTQAAAFAKAVNHLSRERDLVRPVAINGEVATVFAIDLRKAGWHKKPFQSIRKGETTADSANLYDLVLLEYPYGIVYEDSSVFDALVTEYLGPAGLIRPIPFVRMDWFSSVATLPPLYHDLLQLPRQLSDLEQELGIDPQANLDQRLARRGGMTVSGVSRNNRAVERHPYSLGAYWKSIDYASSKGSENIFVDPINLQGTGGEMIFNLPNGLQAYYVCDHTGTRLDEAPTSIVTDKFAEDKTVRNGLSCIRCHDRGMKSFRDDVRPAVEKLSGSGKVDRREVLAQYPARKEMDQLVEDDSRRFLSAMERLLGKPQDVEPMISTSQRYLDAPLQLPTAAGELGLADVSEFRTLVKQPGFTSLGLVALASSGVVRRDMWEDYYDEIVRSMGLGVPVMAIDGVTRPDYLPPSSPLDVRLSTDKKNNVFAPGDELAVFVENRGKSTVFIEVVGTGTRGEKVVLVPAGTTVAAGAKFRFPEAGSIKVQAALGEERITVFASETEFEGGRVLRGKNMDDRFVHPFYKVEMKNGATTISNDARTLVKRTITIETR